MARYYDKLLYSLIIKRIETPNTDQFVSSFTVPITKVAILSKKLLKKTNIPEVKIGEELIKEPLEENFWKVEGISHLEKVRSGIRNLVKYIDPVDQKYATTDFEDELNEDEAIIKEFVGEPRGNYGSPFANNIHRLEELIRKNNTNLTVSRIRQGDSITEQELKSLEGILFNDELKKEEIEKELGDRLDLVKFIINLMGLSADRVNKAFADFINQYQLNSTQIQFLDTIKLFLTKNGEIDPLKLYDAPFKNFHSLGIDGIFNDEQADKIFEILGNINENDQSA